MKRILSTLKEKWPEYLLEIFVLIIGIYGAFAVDNWNSRRLENIEEQEILFNIQRDLENTLLEFSTLNSIRDEFMASANQILQMPTNTVNVALMDSLIGKTFYRPTFNNKMGSINLLFTSGKINLIKNDSIRDLLLATPGFIDDMIEEEVYANEAFQDYYTPIISRYAAFENILPNLQFQSTLLGPSTKNPFRNTEVIKSDYYGLLLDKDFRNQLAIRRHQMQLSSRETSFLIERVEQINSLINKELDQ